MEAQPRGDLRGLKALVGGLGVLVILGTALVIGVVIHRLYAKPVAPSITLARVTPAIGNRLPAGERIKAIAASGADVAVWVSGPDGDRVLLVDPATGRISVALSAGP